MWKVAYVACVQGKLYYGSYHRFDIVMRREPMKEFREYHIGGKVFFFMRGQFNKIMLLRKVPGGSCNGFTIDVEFDANSKQFLVCRNNGFNPLGKHHKQMLNHVACFHNRLLEYDGDFIPMTTKSRWLLAHERQATVSPKTRIEIRHFPASGMKQYLFIN